LSRPNWSRPLPRPLKIPSVMTLKTLADVRELVERRLPDGHRQRSTWQHVEKQLNAAALGKVETIDVAVPLRLVLQLERACRACRSDIEKMFAPNPNRPLSDTLLLCGMVVAFTALGAVILYAMTEWLWLVVHEGLR